MWEDGPSQADHCECDWKWHQGEPCPLPPLEEPGLLLSPALCPRCLQVCCGEREDEQDALDYGGTP